MTDEEVRAYLARWVMEFGTGPVLRRQRERNNWYSDPRTSAYWDPDLVNYLSQTRWDGVQINQAGLDFLKGGEP